MTDSEDKRLMLDVVFKYIVLLVLTGYIGVYLFSAVDINLPDWLVVIYTLVFQYYFRKSPKGGD